MSYSIFVKRLVSQRCRQLVFEVFEDCGLNATGYGPGGEIILDAEPPDSSYKALKNKLSKLGYGIIEDSRAKIIARVKSLLENLISEDTFTMKLKVSEHLAAQLPYEYHYLSGLFSQLEGVTIERFLIQLKIEKIKELIEQDQLKLSEISYKIGYSSPAHFTNQFKKMEGITPSEYRLACRKRQAKE